MNYLPADHYFFVPQVELSNGDFLWLSGPCIIVEVEVEAGPVFFRKPGLFLRQGALGDKFKKAIEINREFAAAYSSWGDALNA